MKPSVRDTHAAYVASLTDADLRADETQIIVKPAPHETASVRGRGFENDAVTHYHQTGDVSHLEADMYGPWGAL